MDEGFVVGLTRADQGSRSGPVGFSAINGAGVLSIPAAAPDHGAGPQGEHMKAEVLCILNVSVPLRDRHALSDLQWPFKYGTCCESSG